MSYLIKESDANGKETDLLLRHPTVAEAKHRAAHLARTYRGLTYRVYRILKHGEKHICSIHAFGGHENA